MSTRPTTQAYRVCTASRTASHFRFCQPLSGLFGPVKIAFYPMTTGSSSVAPLAPSMLLMTFWATVGVAHRNSPVR